MKIYQLFNSPDLILTNEENDFVTRHRQEISIRSLYDRDQILARNLVRKGIYELSTDNQSLILKKNADDRKKSI